MTLRRRLASVVGGKLEALLARLENPGEALEHAYQLLVEQLAAARRTLGELDEVRAGLEGAAARVQEVRLRLEAEAGEAVGERRDEAAREALARSQVLGAGARSLGDEVAELAGERERFAGAVARLEDRVQALAARRQVVRLQGDRSAAAEEAGAWREEAERARDAIRRARSVASERRAQVGRVEALLWSGTVEDLSATPAAIEAELGRARTSGEVDQALERLRRGGPAHGQG